PCRKTDTAFEGQESMIRIDPPALAADRRFLAGRGDGGAKWNCSLEHRFVGTVITLFDLPASSSIPPATRFRRSSSAATENWEIMRRCVRLRAYSSNQATSRFAPTRPAIKLARPARCCWAMRLGSSETAGISDDWAA